MRIHRPRLVPRLVIPAIMAIAAATAVLFWSGRYVRMNGQSKVPRNDPKAKECLKRESLAIHALVHTKKKEKKNFIHCAYTGKQY